MKTSDLTGAALNWAVAKCEDEPVNFDGEIMRYAPGQFSDEEPYTPSTDWSQGGPIIEREKLTVMHDDDWKFDPTDPEDNGERWMANTNDLYYEPTAYGPTPLIAAMRCYVASKLGDEIDLPKELT